MEDDGAMLLLETEKDSFLVVGSGLTVHVSRDPDTDTGVAGIASIEEVAKNGAEWVTVRRLNGDESDQGKSLIMDARRVKIYRVKLYSNAR